MRKTIEEQFCRFRDRGDSSALADVFDAVSPVLGRVAVHLTGDLSGAEDLLQETFLAAMEAAERYDAERPLLPWLLGLMGNHARRARRRSQRKPELERLAPREVGRPEEGVMARELRGAVGEAIGGLPEPYREVLALHLQEAWTPGEVARRLGRSGSTIRTQIQRGLAMLRRGLPAGFAPGLLPMAALRQVRGRVLGRAGGRAIPAAGGGGGAASVIPLFHAAKMGMGVALVLLLGFGLWGVFPARAGREGKGGHLSLLNPQKPEKGSGSTEQGPVVLRQASPNPVANKPRERSKSVSRLGSLEFYPVSVKEGPLLFSVGEEPPGGEMGAKEGESPRGGSGTQQGARQRGRLHFLQTPAHPGPLQVFMRSQNAVQILQRLDSGGILLMSHRDPYGLIALDLPSAKARLVFARPFQKFWAMPGSRVVVLASPSAGETRAALWEIDPKGRAHRRLWECGPDDELGECIQRAQLSPDGWRLAIARPMPRRGQFRMGRAPRAWARGFRLSVYDLLTQKILREIAPIYCDNSPLASSSPRLEFIWLDKNRIRFSESFSAKAKGVPPSQAPKRGDLWPSFRFVDLDARTGKRLSEFPYPTKTLTHRLPPSGPLLPPGPKGRTRKGFFDLEGSKIFYRESLEVLVDTKAPWGWPRFSPEGRFFLLTRNRPRWEAWLFDGQLRRRVVSLRRRERFVWLPGLPK
ncbi:MAG TPA: sigma-70 family RNA polymerase sigma factor [Planctomycetes bacterium]|nr:sigma-70 family RNA polymerase sigma factor [Planctomycetota bacterium]